MSRMLPADYDVLAPDGSEVRILAATRQGSMAHFTLPPGKISKAVRHKTVEEIWFVLSGGGSIWTKQEEHETLHTLAAGYSFSILPGTSFQFRCDSSSPLKVVAVTMPPWPGEGEAIIVQGAWDAEL